jgi:hypothetical protein
MHRLQRIARYYNAILAVDVRNVQSLTSLPTSLSVISVCLGTAYCAAVIHNSVATKNKIAAVAKIGGQSL